MKTIFNIGGPCSAGKDTLVGEVLRRYPEATTRFPRTTTRPRRNNEQEGHHYFFVSHETFEAHRTAGKLAAIDDAAVGKYGVDIEQLGNFLENGCPSRVIIIAGVCGTQLRGYVLRLVNIFVTAEELELVRRLHQRGHSPDDLAKRLEWIEQQLRDEPPQFDYIIENHQDRFSEALSKLLRIMELES